jgi:multiple sugar transport system permease protein
MTKQEKQKLLWGYVFISPNVLGLLLFILFPMLFSLYISFNEWDLVSPMKWLGLKNYTNLFTNDPEYINSLKVSFKYTLIYVPAINLAAFLLSLLLNTKVKGISLFRTIFYLPSIVPFLATALLWTFIYSPMFGLLNSILDIFHIPPQNWTFDVHLVLYSLVALPVWGCGGMMIIYLAALQGVPTHLYEAVEIDGGGTLRKFWSITIPMLSPMIFFNVVMTFIAGMQAFLEASLLTGGGPGNASRFLMLDMISKAFSSREFGSASASAWVLFIIIGMITFLLFKSSRYWVYYESDVRR